MHLRKSPSTHGFPITSAESSYSGLANNRPSAQSKSNKTDHRVDVGYGRCVDPDEPWREKPMPTFWDIKIAEVIQIFVSILGLGYIAYQIYGFKLSRQNEAHARLYSQYMEVCKVLVTNHDLYPYFYEGQENQ